MKVFDNVDLVRAPLLFIKISAFVLVSVTFFYLGLHWSDGYQQLIFFSNRQTPLSYKAPSVAISPNINKTFDISALINNHTGNQIFHLNSPPQEKSPTSGLPPFLPPPPLPLPPPPPASLARLGIVDENGTMADEFEVGDFDPDVVENWGNETEKAEEESRSSRLRVRRFPRCPDSMREYIPCLDNVEAIR